MRARTWIFVGAIAALASFSLFSGGKSQTFICRGTAQTLHNPASTHDAGVVTTRLVRWPNYVHLWSKDYGELTVTSETSMDNFLNLEILGDNLAISDLDGKPAGMLNVISGRLMIHAMGEVYDVNCKPQKPLFGD